MILAVAGGHPLTAVGVHAYVDTWKPDYLVSR
jgi:hypothetical protein